MAVGAGFFQSLEMAQTSRRPELPLTFLVGQQLIKETSGDRQGNVGQGN